ncbi:hypothetical protein [Bifidobacterium tibiigranuli]|uniref:hypothetical protein n=1 Tax=Bifidobacterium tibiigranuli TaxID=2172043 RepID=UPI002354DC2C|nr:hypothetical protein [Bifidobacterium tibiigranuli]MCH3974565.1 hypothetical protein [Bifidobacterium tibiigranuli]MCH4189483.1 hypothetical protein [Bifidobacterium tibiigranuli]MCH4204306.1 hypothetical protein [Bifidobacterium tibiigranuli]MCH4275353.1 hypothetical protein [Bifidobacterium tibiigranuli]MCI1210532.1 hypothetical protein [Bifidobacterium tibiigranuli]
MPMHYSRKESISNWCLLLEGAYTGLLIYWFSYRADFGAQYRTIFMWLHGMLALAALVGIAIMSLHIRKQYPRRWIKSLAYCVCIALALFIWNTDIMRLVVFLAFFGYTITVVRLEHQREA